MSFSWKGTTIYLPGERIDKVGISKCCEDIDKAAQRLKKASEEIKTLAESFDNPQILQVNDNTYSEKLHEYSDKLLKRYNTLHNVVCPTVKRWGEQQYAQEESNYNAYLEERRREEELARQQELERRKQNKMENY